MKLLKSEKLELPQVFLITDRAEINELPIGIPFIYSEAKNEKYLIQLLEYEILYQNALKSGYPFNFKQILKDNGYNDLIEWWYNNTTYLEYTTEDELDLTYEATEEKHELDIVKFTVEDFIKDNSVIVDVEVLKSLNVFPVWLDIIETAIETNIHNFAVFNNNMYNKKLEGMYGSLELTSPKRNLIIIDISGSIPKGVSATCLTLAQNLAESFYADILITGSKSTLYDYSEIHTLNINNLYKENGMDNDQQIFKKLLTNSEKHYETVISFGDNHSPCRAWKNIYNKKTKTISRENGKKFCKWKVNKIINFHTTSSTNLTGYCDWFTIEKKDITFISNWIKYLN